MSATPEQTNVIRTLISERDLEASLVAMIEASLADMSPTEASRVIDLLKQYPKVRSYQP